MKVPFEWLKEFAPIAATASEAAEALTMRGSKSKRSIP